MNRFRTLFIAALMPLLVSGCSVQKTTSDASQERYRLALQALETQHFLIEAREFRYNSKKAEQISSPNSYVSVQGERGSVDFGKLVTRFTTVVADRMLDAHATLIRKKDARNGDRQYSLSFYDGNSDTRFVRLNIRLFKNTNECYVRVFYGNRNPYDFTGAIFPFTDSCGK